MDIYFDKCFKKKIKNFEFYYLNNYFNIKKRSDMSNLNKFIFLYIYYLIKKLF